MSKAKTPIRFVVKKEYMIGSLIDLKTFRYIKSMNWALHDEAFEHQVTDLSASHERSPPR